MPPSACEDESAFAAAILHPRSQRMWAALAFLVAAAIGLAVVLVAGRRGSTQLDSHPWLLHDTAKMHVGVMSSLAGFAFTGVILVVTLAQGRPGVAENSLDTVVVMF